MRKIPEGLKRWVGAWLFVFIVLPWIAIAVGSLVSFLGPAGDALRPIAALIALPPAFYLSFLSSLFKEPHFARQEWNFWMPASFMGLIILAALQSLFAVVAGYISYRFTRESKESNAL